MLRGLSKSVAALVSDPPKCTKFGESDTHPTTYLKSLSNIALKLASTVGWEYEKIWITAPICIMWNIWLERNRRCSDEGIGFICGVIIDTRIYLM